MKIISISKTPPGKIFNGIVFFSFATILCCFLSPSYQVIDWIDITNIFLAFFKLILYAPIILLLFKFNWASLAWLLWLSVLLIWAIRAAYCLIKAPRSLKQLYWWITPLLAWILSLIWATHILLWFNFTIHKPAL